jgi:hypothetical protein
MPDVKISVIFAATEVHIRNVSRTPVLDLRRGSNDPNRLGVGVVHETGTRRGHWNVGIVSRDREAVYWHVSRVARAMVRDRLSDNHHHHLTHPIAGQRWISSLYLHAIVCDPSLRLLRDFEVDRMATWACWRRYGRGRMAPPRDDWGCPEAHCGLCPFPFAAWYRSLLIG